MLNGDKKHEVVEQVLKAVRQAYGSQIVARHAECCMSCTVASIGQNVENALYAKLYRSGMNRDYYRDRKWMEPSWHIGKAVWFGWWVETIDLDDLIKVMAEACNGVATIIKPASSHECITMEFYDEEGQL